MVREIEAVVDPFGRCTPANAAKVLQVSVGTLANWRSEGRQELPYIRAAGKVFYLYDDLMKFARGQAA